MKQPDSSRNWRDKLTSGALLREVRPPETGDSQTFPPNRGDFDPLPLDVIATYFPVKKDPVENLAQWRAYAKAARRNGLREIRVRVNAGSAQSRFNPFDVGAWLVQRSTRKDNAGDQHSARRIQTTHVWTWGHVIRRLASNLPARSGRRKEVYDQHTSRID